MRSCSRVIGCLALGCGIVVVGMLIFPFHFLLLCLGVLLVLAGLVLLSNI